MLAGREGRDSSPKHNSNMACLFIMNSCGNRLITTRLMMGCLQLSYTVGNKLQSRCFVIEVTGFLALHLKGLFWTALNVNF